jgi:hypothetical protein
VDTAGMEGEIDLAQGEAWEGFADGGEFDERVH